MQPTKPLAGPDADSSNRTFSPCAWPPEQPLLGQSPEARPRRLDPIALAASLRSLEPAYVERAIAGPAVAGLLERRGEAVEVLDFDARLNRGSMPSAGQPSAPLAPGDGAALNAPSSRQSENESGAAPFTKISAASLPTTWQGAR
jgi:hypothetical protein